MDIYHSIHTITLQRKIPLEEVSSYRSLLYGLTDMEQAAIENQKMNTIFTCTHRRA